MIQVSVEPWRKLVRAKMSGMLSLEEVHAFAVEMREAAGRMGLGSGEFALLVETQGNTVQRQEVMSLFQDLLTRPQLRARRIAIVRHGMLGRMQARRLAEHSESTQVFDNMPDAEVWLRAA
jgi:hypothetical protein